MLSAVRRVAIRAATPAAWACARPAAAQAAMQMQARAVPAASTARWVHVSAASRFATRPDQSETPALLKRVLFSGFEHKLPRSSIYTVPQSGVDSTTGASLPAVVRVDTTVPFSQLGLDSLDLVELMVALEREFHIELKDEEHDAVKTVEDIINLIHQHPRAQ